MDRGGNARGSFGCKTFQKNHQAHGFNVGIRVTIAMKAISHLGNPWRSKLREGRGSKKTNDLGTVTTIDLREGER